MAKFGKELYTKAGMDKREGTNIVTYFKESAWKVMVYWNRLLKINDVIIAIMKSITIYNKVGTDEPLYCSAMA